MAYYDTIQTPSEFIRRSSCEGAVNFLALSNSSNRKTAASQWGREYLFACRTICSQESTVLPLLANRIRSGMENNVHDCITALLRGPTEDFTTLGTMSELQIIRAYQNDSLGYVWAALAPLLRQGHVGLGGLENVENSPRAIRDRNPPDRFVDFVPSGDIQIGSSSPQRPDSAFSSEGSVGYLEESSAPLVEDFTIRFMSCLIRSVLNYAQPVEKREPFVLYRDERLKYRHLYNSQRYEAIDDGGIQLWNPGRNMQVALVEAKRSFRMVNEGRPTLSDELLGQVVGEALAVRMQTVDREKTLLCPEDVVSVVAVRHFVKVIHLNMTNDFILQFMTMSMTERDPHVATYLNIDSTGWMDLSAEAGRRNFIRHLLALVEWADDKVPGAGGGGGLANGVISPHIHEELSQWD